MRARREMYGRSGLGDRGLLLATSGGVEKSLVLLRYGISFHRVLHRAFIIIRVVEVAVHEAHSNTTSPRATVQVILEVVVPTGEHMDQHHENVKRARANGG